MGFYKTVYPPCMKRLQFKCTFQLAKVLSQNVSTKCRFPLTYPGATDYTSASRESIIICLHTDDVVAG